MVPFFTRMFILTGLILIIIFSKSFTIDVQYKPHTPIIRPNKAQQKATCTAEGNPEPDIVWTLPDGTTDSNPTVLMQVNVAPNFHFINIIFKQVGNPNATYTCMAQNDHGKSLLETTNWDLDQFVGVRNSFVFLESKVVIACFNWKHWTHCWRCCWSYFDYLPCWLFDLQILFGSNDGGKAARIRLSWWSA